MGQSTTFFQSPVKSFVTTWARQQQKVAPGIHPATGNPVLQKRIQEADGDGVLERMAGDAARAEAQSITVSLRHVYSNLTCYPVCEMAQGFADIAGTKTLTPSTLRTIARMGFQIIVEGYPADAIDAFLAGQLK